MSSFVWYLDRAAGLVAYSSLYFAVLTGVFYNNDSFGILHDASRQIHVPVSVFATAVTLIHVGFGLLDTWFVVAGSVPLPDYSMAYFLGGVIVGLGGLLFLVVGVLGYVDARRFERPWGPRTVHAFTYGAFGFGTIHAAAIGTEMVSLVQTILLPSILFLVYVLLLRLWTLVNPEELNTKER